MSSVVTTVRGLMWRWCAYEFAGEFVLLYGVYALLFVETGLSTSQIASLFIVWSATAVLLEVPSGVLADVLSRRLLITVAPLLRASGFALWVLMPSYPAFLAGFILWGACNALQSGATEALVYEELEKLGAQRRYGELAGKARACNTLAPLVAMGAAAPAFAFGGYILAGAASVAVGVGCALTGFSFPAQREHGTLRPQGIRAYGATLRAGLGQVRRDRRVAALVLLVTAATAIWGSLEEYVPLLAIAGGAANASLPLYIALIGIGVTAGGLCVTTASRLRPVVLAGLLSAATAATVVGAYSGLPGLAAIAVAFGVFHLVGLLAEVKLQDAITGRARATVTSVAGLGVEAGTIAVYGGYALAVPAVGHEGAFAGVAAGYLGVAVVLAVSHRLQAVGRQVGDPGVAGQPQRQVELADEV